MIWALCLAPFLALYICFMTACTYTECGDRATGMGVCAQSGQALGGAGPAPAN